MGKKKIKRGKEQLHREQQKRRLWVLLDPLQVPRWELLTPAWTLVSFTWSHAESLHPLPGKTGAAFPFRVRNSSVPALSATWLPAPATAPSTVTLAEVFLQTLKAMPCGSQEHPGLQERLLAMPWTVMGLNWGAASQLLRAVIALSYLKGVEAHHRDTWRAG